MSEVTLNCQFCGGDIGDRGTGHRLGCPTGHSPRDETKVLSKSLSSALRETTQEMAVSCSVPMELWNCHSNTCLEAADALDDLLASLREYVRDFGDNEDPDSRQMRRKAKAAIARAEGQP